MEVRFMEERGFCPPLEPTFEERKWIKGFFDKTGLFLLIHLGIAKWILVHNVQQLRILRIRLNPRQLSALLMNVLPMHPLSVLPENEHLRNICPKKANPTDGSSMNNPEAVHLLHQNKTQSPRKPPLRAIRRPFCERNRSASP